MKWKTVQDLAASHGLEIYTPMCGYHRQAQIIDRAANRHWWTANKAGLAYQSLQTIIKQRELAQLSNEQAIADGQQAKSFF
jgi:hypothetical protein